MINRNKQNKYGFIYLWMDIKKKMYYVGSHWGTEDDGYICSSKRMGDNYRYRPQDFKRRIIKRLYTNHADLLKEEQRYLNMIKPYERGRKYYNINIEVRDNAWYSDPIRKATVSEKIKAAIKDRIRKPHSPETIRKLKAAAKRREANITPEQKAVRSRKPANFSQTMHKVCKGRPSPRGTGWHHSKKTRQKISQSNINTKAFKNIAA